MTSFTRKQGDKRRHRRMARKPPDVLRKGHKHMDKRKSAEEDERAAIAKQLEEKEAEERAEIEDNARLDAAFDQFSVYDFDHHYDDIDDDFDWNDIPYDKSRFTEDSEA